MQYAHKLSQVRVWTKIYHYFFFVCDPPLHIFLPLVVPLIHRMKSEVFLRAQRSKYSVY